MPSVECACIAAEKALMHQEFMDELRERPNASAQGPEDKSHPLNPLFSTHSPHESGCREPDSFDEPNLYYIERPENEEEEEEDASPSANVHIHTELLESIIKPSISGMRRSLVYGGRIVEKAAKIMSVHKDQEEQSQTYKSKDRTTSSGWDDTLFDLPNAEEESNRVQRASAASNLAAANSLLTSVDTMMEWLLQARNSPLCTAQQKASQEQRRMEDCSVWQECLEELQKSAQRLITFIFARRLASKGLTHDDAQLLDQFCVGACNEEYRGPTIRSLILKEVKATCDIYKSETWRELEAAGISMYNMKEMWLMMTEGHIHTELKHLPSIRPMLAVYESIPRADQKRQALGQLLVKMKFPGILQPLMIPGGVQLATEPEVEENPILHLIGVSIHVLVYTIVIEVVHKKQGTRDPCEIYNYLGEFLMHFRQIFDMSHTLYQEHKHVELMPGIIDGFMEALKQ